MGVLSFARRAKKNIAAGAFFPGNTLFCPKNVPRPTIYDPHNTGMISQKLRGHLFGFPPLVVNFTTNKTDHDDRITYITYYFFH